MKKKTLIVLLLLSVLLTLSAQTPPHRYHVDKDDYFVWRLWTDEQKSYYIWGVLSGAWAMASDLAYISGYTSFIKEMEQALPRLTVGEYRTSIDYIYEMVDYRTVPVSVIIFRLESLLEERRSYE